MKSNTTFFKKMIKPLLIVGLLSSALNTTHAHAESAWFGAKIIRTLADEHFGGCMIALDVDVKTLLPNCGTSWVSLDCDSVYHTPEQSNAMWSSALMAFALNKTVAVRAHDDRIVNNYCSISRIDVVQ